MFLFEIFYTEIVNFRIFEYSLIIQIIEKNSFHKRFNTRVEREQEALRNSRGRAGQIQERKRQRTEPPHPTLRAACKSSFTHSFISHHTQ